MENAASGEDENPFLFFGTLWHQLPLINHFTCETLPPWSPFIHSYTFRVTYELRLMAKIVASGGLGIESQCNHRRCNINQRRSSLQWRKTNAVHCTCLPGGWWSGFDTRGSESESESESEMGTLRYLGCESEEPWGRQVDKPQRHETTETERNAAERKEKAKNSLKDPAQQWQFEKESLLLVWIERSQAVGKDGDGV